MNTDSAFRKGYSHEVCEDYAYSMDDLIIVCDGCSSAEDTDLGSRIIAMAVKGFIEDFGNDRHIITDIRATIAILLQKIESISFAMLGKKNSESLYSTLLFAFKHRDGLVIFVAGDGIVSFIGDDGARGDLRFSNQNGYPFYLPYLSNMAEYRSYSLLDSIEVSNNDEGFISNLLLGSRTDHNDAYHYFISNETLETCSCKYVLLSSDGIESFTKEMRTGTSLTKVSVSHEDVLENFLPFKSTKGKFVKRRMNGFLKKCKKEGQDHFDDFSIAVMDLTNESI